MARLILIRRELSVLRREYHELQKTLETQRELIYNKPSLHDLPTYFDRDRKRLRELEAMIEEKENIAEVQ